MQSMGDSRLANATKEECLSAFIDNVQEKLHIVLAMSPAGDVFRTRQDNHSCYTAIDFVVQVPEATVLSELLHDRLVHSMAARCSAFS